MTENILVVFNLAGLSLCNRHVKYSLIFEIHLKKYLCPQLSQVFLTRPTRPTMERSQLTSTSRSQRTMELRFHHFDDQDHHYITIKPINTIQRTSMPYVFSSLRRTSDISWRKLLMPMENFPKMTLYSMSRLVIRDNDDFK